MTQSLDTQSQRLGATTFFLDGVTPIHLEMFEGVVLGGQSVSLSESCEAKMAASRNFLETLIADNALIYGVTTGFGPLANQYITPEQSALLQQNLVYHLCSGVGEPLSEAHTRALMFARLVNISRGYSAILPESARHLQQMLNLNILPVIPAMGTVGASGDLTPLAHMTLAMMGQADVICDGQRMPALEAFEKYNLKPLTLEAKEGLAFVNGTSVMTGIAAVNAVLARRAIEWSLGLSVLYAELFHARTGAFHPNIAMVRPHPGQISVTHCLQQLIADSQRLVHQTGKPSRLNREQLNADGISHDQELIQDPYTIRCLPQIYGAILDVLTFHNNVVTTELNSVTDNPLFFPEEESVFHGGNFYGQHVSFASDALTNAVIKMGIHAERCIARITDVKLNNGFPAFMQRDKVGLQSGFMGAQVTATATLAEMRSLATPASIQSIPTNANNQDVVTMGTIAARKTAQILDYLYYILSIESLVLVQGMDLCDDREAFSSSSKAIYEAIRGVSAELHEDRPFYTDIDRGATFLKNHAPIYAKHFYNGISDTHSR